MKVYVVFYSQSGSSDCAMMGVYDTEEAAHKRWDDLVQDEGWFGGDEDLAENELAVVEMNMNEDKHKWLW